MTNLFFSIAGLLVGQTGILILYINAKIDGKIDPLREQVNLLVQYMISHEGRISILEERTGTKGGSKQ
jgi:hypothetical protein